MERATFPDAMERTTIPDTPDTERTDPLTPAPSTDSVEVSVDLESSAHPRSRRTLTDPARSLAKTARSAGQSKSPQLPEEQSSNTTMQSMMRPDLKMSGVPDSRRFLSIENDLDQLSATVRLLEKGLIGAQKEARIAWILATVALVLAALAVAL